MERKNLWKPKSGNIFAILLLNNDAQTGFPKTHACLLQSVWWRLTHWPSYDSSSSGKLPCAASSVSSSLEHLMCLYVRCVCVCVFDFIRILLLLFGFLSDSSLWDDFIVWQSKLLGWLCSGVLAETHAGLRQPLLISVDTWHDRGAPMH